MSATSPNYGIVYPTPTTKFKDLGTELMDMGIRLEEVLASFDYNGADPGLVAARVASLETKYAALLTRMTAVEARKYPRQLFYAISDMDYAPPTGSNPALPNWGAIPNFTATLPAVAGKLKLSITGALFNGSSGTDRDAGIRFKVNGAVLGDNLPAAIRVNRGVGNSDTPISRTEQTLAPLAGNVTVTAEWTASAAPAVGSRLRFEVTEIPA